MASNYPSWTPYNYVMVNPLRLVDPKGMSAEDIYEMDDKGYISKKCDLPGPDILYKKGDNKNFIVVSDENLLPSLSNIITKTEKDEPYYRGSLYESSDKDETYKVFEWAARNSSVEWGIEGYYKNGDEVFVLSTHHSVGFSIPVTTLDNLFWSEINKTFDIHSHKGEYSYVPSGEGGDNDHFIKGQQERFNVGVTETVPYYIYDVTNSTRFQYNSGPKGFNKVQINTYKDLYEK